MDFTLLPLGKIGKMVSKSEWLEREATGIGSGNGCTSGKITRALSLTLSLEIAVDSITAVSFDSVGVVTRPIGMDRVTISPSSTSIVQSFL